MEPNLGPLGRPSWPKLASKSSLEALFFQKRDFSRNTRKTNVFSRFLPPKTAPKTAQDRPKTPPRRSWSATFPALKNVTDFGPFSARFGVPLGVPVGLPWGPLGVPFGVPFGVPKRTYLEDTPKSPPRRPQDAPRGSQEPPGRPPGGSQNAPKTLQEACQSPIKPYKAL